jgi:hypothetical protein
MPGGGYAIVCGGHRGKLEYCQDCIAQGRKTPSTILCDGPAPEGSKQKTCDRRCCRAHATPIGPDRDLCTKCAPAAEKQRLAL